MNIHPLFVHFPIALLALYSVLEIAVYCSPALRRQDWVFGTKMFLLFTGSLTALVTLASGGIAEDLIRDTNPRTFIFEMHEPFAVATTLLYLVLASAYLMRIFDTRGWGDRIAGTNRLMVWSWNFKKRFWYAFLNSPFLPLIAFLALVGMTITGALGAAIVYGPDIDPLVSLVYHLFWI